ncbi:hypothetical protein [Calothrix rhizosoleniae]|uniref:hypothetical protein n=1 Tax=Calothrix rhizosoleniae TaxID=888997 RepID=UPI000B49B179|nr:hypothetical protein [Calothrix rhizosoleniae]
MEYTFNIVGVSHVLNFFDRQQTIAQTSENKGIEYIATHTCTLDALIASVEAVPPKVDWNLDRVVDTVIQFWLNNSDSIIYWKSRLQDAGKDNLLVARLADIQSLRYEFEFLLEENW